MKSSNRLRGAIKKSSWHIIFSFLLAVPMANVAAAAPKQDLSAPKPASAVPADTFFNGTDRGTQVQISNHGNIVSYESPSGSEHIGVGILSEGYVLCYAGNNAFDVGSSESGFGAASISQPSPTKTIVTRNTSDGRLQLRQTFTFEGVEKALSIVMTIRNLTTSTVSGVTLRRQVDFDIDGSPSSNRFGRTSEDGVFAYRDASDFPGTEVHGMLLQHQQKNSTVARPVAKVTNAILDTSCNPSSIATPAGPGDFGATLQYNFGNVSGTASKLTTVRYLRF